MGGRLLLTVVILGLCALALWWAWGTYQARPHGTDPAPSPKPSPTAKPSPSGSASSAG